MITSLFEIETGCNGNRRWGQRRDVYSGCNGAQFVSATPSSPTPATQISAGGSAETSGLSKLCGILSVVVAAFAGTVWAFEPIRINFNDNAQYDVDGWTSVSYAAAKGGFDCGQGVTLTMTGGAGWYYGGVQTNKLQKLYVDDSGAGIHLAFSGFPRGTYTVKAYFACDWGSQFSPLEVNGVNFTYVDGEVRTGSTSWGDAKEKAMVLGANVIEVPGVSVSDSELMLSAYGKIDSKRNGFAAIEIVPYEYKADTPTTLSINVASASLAEGAVSKTLFVPGLAGGEIPGYSWLNVSSASNHFEDVAYWDGDRHVLVTNETGVTVNVTANDNYSNGSASGANIFLRNYLDDNWSSTGISVTGLPFKLYDVIVYMNADWVYSGKLAFNPVNVNGTKYSWDSASGTVVKSNASWGARGFPTAIPGTNALRIAGLSDSSLSVVTGGRGGPARGGFAAMQVVRHDYADIVAEGDMTTAQVEALANGKKEVLLTLPAGATLTIAKKILTCDTLYVLSEGDVRIATWNNIEPQEGTVCEANYGKINADRVKGLVFHGWKPTKRILSLNFNSDAKQSAMPSTWTFGGALAAEEVVSASWNNLPSVNTGTNEAPVVWNGDLRSTNVLDALTVEWDGKYYSGGSSADVFRRSWFDGNQKHATVTVRNLPFEKYDVIVYMNWDGGSYGYGAPYVNGSQWTYDSETNKVVQGTARWGNNSCGAKAEMKVNAIRVPDQTASTCVIETAGYCGNICAVQIIEYCPPVKELKNGLLFLVR